MRVLLLTGARLMEVARMERQRAECGRCRLDPPGSRTKKYRGRLARAAAAPALEIVAQIPQIDGGRFVFSIDDRGPITGWSRTKAKLDAAMGGN